VRASDDSHALESRQLFPHPGVFLLQRTDLLGKLLLGGALDGQAVVDRSEVQKSLRGDAQCARGRARELDPFAPSRMRRQPPGHRAHRQQKLAQQIRTLEQENARVREELATFESMLSSEARTANALSIYRFKVEPDVLPGEYRYRLLLLNTYHPPGP